MVLNNSASVLNITEIHSFLITDCELSDNALWMLVDSSSPNTIIPDHLHSVRFVATSPSLHPSDIHLRGYC